MITQHDNAVQVAGEADILWFLPTHGDGRYLGSNVGARHVTLSYLGQIARAADELGYYGVLLPTGKSCEDSWVVASAMVPLTERFALPCRRTAWFVRAIDDRADGSDAGPAFRRPFAGQRGCWRRSIRAGRRWGVSRPRCSLRSGRRIPDRVARPVVRQDGRFGRSPSAQPGRQADLSAGAKAAPAIVFRWLFGGRPGGCGRACGRLSHLGRTSGWRAREDRADARGSSQAGANALLWNPAACHRARDGEGSMGSGGCADQPSQRRGHRKGAACVLGV